jgi:hypothetical protein
VEQKLRKRKKRNIREGNPVNCGERLTQTCKKLFFALVALRLEGRVRKHVATAPKVG